MCLTVKYVVDKQSIRNIPDNNGRGQSRERGQPCTVERSCYRRGSHYVNVILMFNFSGTERFPQRFNIGKSITDVYL